MDVLGDERSRWRETRFAPRCWRPSHPVGRAGARSNCAIDGRDGARSGALADVERALLRHRCG